MICIQMTLAQNKKGPSFEEPLIKFLNDYYKEATCFARLDFKLLALFL